MISPEAVLRTPSAPRWYLTSPEPPSGSDDDRVDRPLPLELAEDRLVGLSDRVREDAQPAAVRHPDHDLVRPRLGDQRNRLVEHRDEHIEALDRELLLAEEDPSEVPLEAVDLGQALEQAALLVGLERLPVLPRLDRLPEPDATLVVGDVLDLVRDRAAVGVPEPREGVGKRLGGDVETQQRRRDTRLELGSEPGNQPLGLERRVAHRLGAERIEMGGEVAVHAVRLDERHRRGDAAEEQVVGGTCGRRFGRRRRRYGRGARGGAVAVLGRRRGELRALEQAGEARKVGEGVGGVRLEQGAPLGRDRVRILEVLLEDRAGVARIQSVDVHRFFFCTNRLIPTGDLGPARRADAR